MSMVDEVLASQLEAGDVLVFDRWSLVGKRVEIEYRVLSVDVADGVVNVHGRYLTGSMEGRVGPRMLDAGKVVAVKRRMNPMSAAAPIPLYDSEFPADGVPLWDRDVLERCREEMRPGVLHNCVAHPLLAIPGLRPAGRWLHERTSAEVPTRRTRQERRRASRVWGYEG